MLAVSTKRSKIDTIDVASMPKDDEISRRLTLSIKKLQTAKKNYEEGEISPENTAKLLALEEALSKNIERIGELVKPRSPDSSQTVRPTFSRTTFYSAESPYLNRMDSSKSFRLVPPMKVKKSPAPGSQTKRRSPNEFLLSSLQLLENITNLQRLHSVRGDKTLAPFQE